MYEWIAPSGVLVRSVNPPSKSAPALRAKTRLTFHVTSWCILATNVCIKKPYKQWKAGR